LIFQDIPIWYTFWSTTRTQYRKNEKDAIIMNYLAQMHHHSEYNEMQKVVTPPIAQFFIKQDKEINQQLLDRTNKLSFLEKKNLLKNLDILDKLVTIIDPKKDFASTSQKNNNIKTCPTLS